MSLKDKWREVQGKGLDPGIYRYDGKGEYAHHRFHLRVDSRHKGILLVDASSIIYLNGTALDYVRSALEDRSDQDAAKYMMRRYKHLDEGKATADYHLVREQLNRFLHGEEEVMNIIGSETMTFGSDDFPAPYRMDLVLTYRCQNRCGHCYNEPRELKELTTDQWKEVIAKLWNMGVPHVVFTGGEPTLRPDLQDLISKSEEFGQVTGLVTNGRMLGRPGYLHELIAKGLDHVQITVLSHKPDVHDRLVGGQGAWKDTVEGLKVAVSEDLYVSTNTTLMPDNLKEIEDTMRFIISLGVKNIAFNGLIRSGKGKSAEGISCEDLSSTMGLLKSIAEESNVKLIWYTPTPYCEFNPINQGLGIKQCTACALNMAVEPDGSVLPCQSYYRSLGNILTDPWESIWNHELCQSIRERRYLTGECVECEMKDTCGGGCPLAREHGDYICLDTHSTM
jgi:radical SAM protein with 4Fe4S-binding SPASM domain